MFRFFVLCIITYRLMFYISSSANVQIIIESATLITFFHHRVVQRTRTHSRTTIT